MSRKRMPGGGPEPGWTPQEHQLAAAWFHAGMRAGLDPEWPPSRESLTADGRVTAAGYVEPGRAQLPVAVPLAQMDTAQGQQLAERDALARRLTMTPAYLLCIFLGTLGLHRFYMRRKGSGLAMLLITLLSVGILGLLVCLPWAVVDLFLIPGIVRQENTKALDDSYRRYGLALAPGAHPHGM
jgi:TM2 domain-containing membrane protein YozV